MRGGTTSTTCCTTGAGSAAGSSTKGGGGPNSTAAGMVHPVRITASRPGTMLITTSRRRLASIRPAASAI
ncbi:hypothetical protein ACFSHQ_18100 [Gemmobacter lanyuensis]